MSKRLAGKVAIVTGGNSGIGLETAKVFEQQGAQVVITGRRKDVVDAAAAEIGGSSIGIQSDTANLADIDALYKQVNDKFGKIDILFLNAGIAKFAPIESIDEALFDSMVNTNLKGLFFGVQKSLPYLADKTSIILNTSIAAQLGLANTNVYSATKAAVRSLARTLSSELVERGVRVNALAPGHVQTPIFGKLGLSEEVISNMAENLMTEIPMKRFGQPADIAKAALFLASDESSYMAGTETVVDGGVSQL